MDTYSLADAARRLGTSSPRVRRAVDRLGLPIEQDSSGVFHLTEEQVSELARELGVTPLIPGMSRTDAQVIAALSRSPRGVSSAREAARRAGVSPTAAGRALARLVAKGLITQTPIMLARGHASEVTVYQVRFGSDEWLALAPVVAKVQLPDRANRPRAKRVPRTCCTCSGTRPPLSLMSLRQRRISPGGCLRRSTRTALPGAPSTFPPVPGNTQQPPAAFPAQRALAHNLARYARAV